MKTLKDYLEGKYRVVGECWVWTGVTDRVGYGQFSYPSKTPSGWTTLRAHRASYKVYKGTIPKGKLVCHRCDRPACINPDHLFLGSQRDNMQDMRSKGRGPVQVGESNHEAKLSEAQARSIKNKMAELKRLTHKQRYGRVAQLAREFGVSPVTVRQIAQGRIWSHV